MNNRSQLEKIFEQDGKIFIGMCHPNLYGPVRGMNAILTVCDAEGIDKFMGSERHYKMCQKIWEKTGMGAQMMVLPAELIQECETTPKEFSSLKELLDYLEGKIKKAVGVDKDPFYYRLGII